MVIFSLGQNGDIFTRPKCHRQLEVFKTISYKKNAWPLFFFPVSLTSQDAFDKDKLFTQPKC